LRKRAAGDARERLVSPAFESHLDAGEQPVAGGEPSLDPSVAYGCKGSVAPVRSHEKLSLAQENLRSSVGRRMAATGRHWLAPF
jgi:hypothetical protein